jgi:hypothetical protein
MSVSKGSCDFVPSHTKRLCAGLTCKAALSGITGVTTRHGTETCQAERYPILEDLGVEKQGFHDFRRFRITHLEAVRAHGHLTKIWAGHSLGNDITSEYAKSLRENLPLRLEEAEKVGTGFAVPAPACSKISGAQAVAVAA